MQLNISLMIVFTVITIIAIVFGAKKIRKTEFWQLAKEYIKTKKEKVCPMLEIVD